MLYWLAALALAGVLLYWSVRGLDWARVWRTLTHARLSYVGICCALATATLFLRAVRWRVLLSAAGPVKVADAFWATTAGYLGNNFLPARAGEVVRTMMVAARAGLGRAFILTTALSERMVDAILLVLIAALVLWWLPSKPAWIADAAGPLAAAGMAGVIAIAAGPFLLPVWDRICKRLPLPEKLRTRLDHVVRQIVLGLRSFHHAGRLLGFFGLSAVIWFLDGVNVVLSARALGFTLALPVAFLLIAGLGLASALPSTPGYVGVYQFVAVTVLTPFGFLRDDAIAYILLVQALQYAMITAWGLLALWITGAGSMPARSVEAAE